MRKHFNIRVSGRVQGVFFRASTKTSADQLNISGFVRNEPDGSVYIEAEGEEKKLEEFIDWCHKGPTSAQVDKVALSEMPVQDFQGFEIRKR